MVLLRPRAVRRASYSQRAQHSHSSHTRNDSYVATGRLRTSVRPRAGIGINTLRRAIGMQRMCDMMGPEGSHLCGNARRHAAHLCPMGYLSPDAQPPVPPPRKNGAARPPGWPEPSPRWPPSCDDSASICSNILTTKASGTTSTGSQQQMLCCAPPLEIREARRRLESPRYL